MEECIRRLTPHELQVIHSLLLIAFTILPHYPQQSVKPDQPQLGANAKMISSWKTKFLFHSGLVLLLHMASRKGRLPACWAPSQGRGARIAKNWPGSSQSHRLFWIFVSSLRVLTLHLSWAPVPLTPPLRKPLYSQGSSRCLASTHTTTQATAPNSSSESRQLQFLGCLSPAKSVLGSRTKSLLAVVSQGFSHSCYFPH